MMTFEEALSIVNTVLAPESLTELQADIFRGAWDNQSYQKIALQLNHEYSYIKDVGAELWQLLSQGFDEKVTKLNVQEVLVQRSQNHPLAISMRSNFLDWGEAPDTSQFHGRESQMTTLEQWIVQDHCRLITVVGIAGMGKTMLVTKLAEQIADQFDIVIWRSLQQAPPISNLLGDLLNTISAKNDIPVQVDELLRQLLKCLRSSRCLIILDQVEAVLSGGEIVGNYRAGYEDYRWLFEQLGRAQHQSSILLTGRETPLEVIAPTGTTTPVRLLRLKPLLIPEAEVILAAKGLSVSNQRSHIQQLIEQYHGNPMMLKSVAAIICDLYDENVAAFLAEEILLFKDIRDLIAQQFDRLSSTERQVMDQLAISPEPMTIAQLHTSLLPSVSSVALRDALISLDRRSLIEKVKRPLETTIAPIPLNSMSYTQQPTVREYAVEHSAQSRSLQKPTRKSFMRMTTSSKHEPSSVRLPSQYCS